MQECACVCICVSVCVCMCVKLLCQMQKSRKWMLNFLLLRTIWLLWYFPETKANNETLNAKISSLCYCCFKTLLLKSGSVPLQNTLTDINS